MRSAGIDGIFGASRSAGAAAGALEETLPDSELDAKRVDEAALDSTLSARNGEITHEATARSCLA